MLLKLQKKAIFDTIAVILAGSSWEVSPQIAALLKEWGGKPESRVLIYGYKLPAPNAAFANGAMARAIDMGDVHELAGHVTEWNIPALLAALGIVGRPVTGKEFLTAYIVGAELSVRTVASYGGSSHSDSGMPGEFNGALCATASVSRLLGLTLDETWNALGISYSNHGLSETQKYAEGTQMPRVQHGFAAETSIKAVLLAQQGVTGPKGIYMGTPAGLFRHIQWDEVYPELLTENLGEKWLFADGLSLKPYPCCKFTHSYISATIELMQQQGINWQDIDRIHCIGSVGTHMVIEPQEAKWNPKTTGEALFSAPYIVATAAIKGSIFLEEFSLENILSRKTQQLMKKISFSMDPKISTQFDGFTIEMTLKNGDTYRHTNQYVLGHIKNPMSWSNVTDKFWKCSAHLAVPLLKTQLENVIKLCTNLDVVSDMSELVENLTP